MPITQDQAINLCREFECKLAPDYHVALTGSCLYGPEFAKGDVQDCYKDADILIYPKNNEKDYSIDEALKRLGAIPSKILNEKYERVVCKAVVDGFNLDFMFVGWP